MSPRDEALAYAKEVYAACLTIGFAGASVSTLRSLIEACAAADADAGLVPDLLQAAGRAHREAAAWAGRP